MIYEATQMILFNLFFFPVGFTRSCNERQPFVCETLNVTSAEKGTPEPHPLGTPCGGLSQHFKDKVWHANHIPWNLKMCVFLMPSLYMCIAVLLALIWIFIQKLQWCQWVLQNTERLDAHHIWPSWTGFVWFYIALKSTRTYLNINTSLTHLTTFHHVHLASI